MIDALPVNQIQNKIQRSSGVAIVTGNDPG